MGGQAPAQNAQRPLWVALERACIGAVVLAGSAFFGVWSTTNNLRAAGIAAGIAFFGQLILRGGAEGWIDTSTARNLID